MDAAPREHRSLAKTWVKNTKENLRPKLLFLLAVAVSLFASQNSATQAKPTDQKILVFANFKRLSDKPILGPRAGRFDSAGAFNPAATLLKNGHTVLLYRGQDAQGVSRIGYAESSNGIDFVADGKAVITPNLDDDKDGVEDARLTRDFKSSNRDNSCWLATATAYSKATNSAQLVSYRSSPGDLHHWQRVAVLMPATTAPNKAGWNIHWTKSGAIVVDSEARPLKIKNRYWMYYMADARGTSNSDTTNSGGKMAADQMGIAQSNDGMTWQDALGRPILPHRPGQFDSRVVEPGPHPIITKDGILLLYNGGDDSLTYSTGWALFDKKDPTKLLARCTKAIFEPELAWEKKNASSTVHQVPNVVFVEGIVPYKRGYRVYYGSADSYVGVAYTELTLLRNPTHPKN
ncbi:glycosidase [bacterium]|nr:glycosidase [bacterium]MBP9811168.1 glycosidase [bacterium]